MTISLDGTGGITPPQWTTASRPANPTNAQLGFNTTLNYYEWYDTRSSSWIPVGQTLISVTSANTSGNITPNANTTTQLNLDGLTGNVSILAPTGSPIDGQRLLFRIEDNGVAQRTITWTTTGSGSYREVGVVLPTATTLTKTTYVGTIYNATDIRWDVIAVAVQT